MHYHTHLFLFALVLLLGCDATPESSSDSPEETTTTPEAVANTVAFQNDAHRIVYESVQRVGDYADLLAKRDVIYEYTYRTPGGQEDISTEKYYFDGEYSLGVFKQRARTLPETQGQLIQGYDGARFWTMLDGEPLTTEAAQQRTEFSRKTNFYWFAMNQKLLDPGLNYEYLREQAVDGQTYDVVSVSFDDSVGVAQDIYHLFINRETKLIDQFLFTVMAFGREEPLLMRNTYEDFDGVQLATYRKYTPSNWRAEVLQEAWTEEISENLRFNNGLTRKDFQPEAF